MQRSRVEFDTYCIQAGEVGMNCKDCIMFDVDHYEMYEEPICSMGDFVIRLKHGQGKPDNCPFRLKRNTDKNSYNLVSYLERLVKCE